MCCNKRSMVLDQRNKVLIWHGRGHYFSFYYSWCFLLQYSYSQTLTIILNNITSIKKTIDNSLESNFLCPVLPQICPYFYTVYKMCIKIGKTKKLFGVCFLFWKFWPSCHSLFCFVWEWVILVSLLFGLLYYRYV